MLRQTFFQQVSPYAPQPVAEQFWTEIETTYTEGRRYFHNLAHLEQMLTELQPVQANIHDWPTLFFALCYHDIVYDIENNIVLNDNEEKSAELAQQRLASIGFPAAKIEACTAQILATKSHRPSTDEDTNYLLDADLSILGQPWKTYKIYKDNIRKEYSIYADSIYKAGRRKFLETFLKKNRLFSTAYFHQLYEKQAKENMNEELAILKAL